MRSAIQLLPGATRRQAVADDVRVRFSAAFPTRAVCREERFQSDTGLGLNNTPTSRDSFSNRYSLSRFSPDLTGTFLANYDMN